ncbi:MAG: hypothetical protein LBO67_02905 [Spirochaetaceae bacterium]|nr:hypothetical protein [Spirochaetaceae bacterium]
MKATKQALIIFLDENVLLPAENHPQATPIIKRKVRATRMRLNKLTSPEKVEEFFWNAMASDNPRYSIDKVSIVMSHSTLFTCPSWQ